MTSRTTSTLNHLKVMKLQKKNKQFSSTRLLDLPRALVTDIVGHVVSSSFTELYNVRSTCKYVCQISEEEGFIYKQVCLEKFPIVAWQNIKKHFEFLKRCRDNKNPEALYREGVIQYFGSLRLEVAIKYLEEAINSGHIGACYALGVIYILSGDELKKQKGIRILGEIMQKSKTTGTKLKDYRANLKLIISRIWKNPLVFKERPVCCTVMQHKLKKKKQKTGWLIVDEIIHCEDEDGNICEACVSDFEIQLIL